jgi:hypothetical protein
MYEVIDLDTSEYLPIKSANPGGFYTLPKIYKTGVLGKLMATVILQNEVNVWTITF